MKEQNINLTLQETEQLCRQYLDCTLSVLEETELKYVLSRIDYHSELIDEVRALMSIEYLVTDKNDKEIVKKPRRHRFPLYLSLAASIALLLGIAVFHEFLPSRQAEPYYIAYAGGHQLSPAEAKSQIENDVRLADEFIKHMSELETREKLMIEDFTTRNSFDL